MSIIRSENNRFYAEIDYDEWAENPRKVYDHDSTIIYHSSHYMLGDKDIAPEDFTLPDDVYAFPVYAYIHGTITLSLSHADVSMFDPQGWDSGQSGIMYMPKSAAANADEAYRIMQSELEEFSNYLNDQCYTVSIYNAEEELLDTCAGFYGYDYARQDAIDTLAYYERTTPMQGSLLEVI